MGRSWRIGRIMGIDVALDVSWFVIAFLLIYALGFVQFPRDLHPRSFGRPDVVSIMLGVATCLTLFASVLAHEFSHSWMAINRGIPVTRITLFIFGGVAQIADEPDRPSTEFLIAIMGPLMSLALAALFGGAWLWLQVLDSAHVLTISLLPFIIFASFLAQINAQLALFNLAPGFPLDGGRIFRSIVWGVSHNVRRATLWATRVGQAIALALIGAGVWLFLAQFNAGGLWFALIGLFLWNAATESYRQTALTESLRGVSVGALMTRDVESVSPDLALIDFVNQYLLPKHDQTFAVSDGSVFQGLISIDNIKRVARSEWAVRRVRDVMTPRGELESLAPDQTAAAALSRLSRSDAGQLPVVESGQVTGFLGRAELSRFLKLRAE